MTINMRFSYCVVVKKKFPIEKLQFVLNHCLIAIAGFLKLLHVHGDDRHLRKQALEASYDQF